MRAISVATCCVLLLISSCKSKEDATVQADEKNQTFCIGRHMIDLPTDFRQILPISATFAPPRNSEDATSLEIKVNDKGATLEAFEKSVGKRWGEIVAFANDTTDILKEVIRHNDGEVLFRIQRIDDTYSSELHLLKASSYLTVDAMSYGGHFVEMEQKIWELAQENIDALQDVPLSKPGFCLGPVQLNGKYEQELANFVFRSKERPGVVVSIEIDTYTRDAREDLLQRVSGPDSLLKVFDVRNKVLRKGERAVAGMLAQEWLSSAMLGEKRQQRNVSFVLETMRPHPGPNSPSIRVELNATPEGVAASDKQLITLWDAITSTIRLAESAHN